MKVYEKVYDYYVNQIKNKALNPGDKIPSIRETEKILSVSRTSVETGYLQLAADGYIYSVEKVGYYVSEIVDRVLPSEDKSTQKQKPGKLREKKYKYDLATIGEDKEISCIALWRRYMKSALRQEDRLLSYPSSQGEEDLRREIAAHVRKTRNIICSADDVVIGAGFQNLLQILIALIPGEKTISFPTKDFADGATTFRNAGFAVNYRNKECHVIYVTPSYMTKWGDVMTMKRRHELIDHALNNNHLIIEDDYQNDFVFSSKPTPSLYAMTGGENTAYLGSFSRIVLPSVRVSFIILPKGVREEYEGLKNYYNQTASIAEQIALAQFLRDGHLNRHIKKMRVFYEGKREILITALKNNISDDAKLFIGNSGMEIGISVKGKEKIKNLRDSKTAVNFLESSEDEAFVLVSCSKIPAEDINKAVEKIKL